MSADNSTAVADRAPSRPMRLGERWASALGICIQRDGVAFDRARYAYLKAQLVFRMDVAGDADPLGVFSSAGTSRSVAASSRVVRGSIIDDSDASESEESDGESESDGHPHPAPPGARSQPATGWAQFFSDETLLSEINTDLERLFPAGHEALFRRDDLRDALRHVLFVWCKLHPDVSYRQGMHDVAAVVLYAFLERDEHAEDADAANPFASARAADDDEPAAVAAASSYTLPESAESDTFLVFEAIMLYLKPFYEIVQTPPAQRLSRGANGAHSAPLSATASSSQPSEQRLFGSYPEHETSSGTGLFGESVPSAPHSSPATLASASTDSATKPRSALPALSRICHSVQYELLQQKDPQLFYHLQNLEIVPETYCLRWVRLLLAREFGFDELLEVWDAMIHDHARPDIVFPTVSKDEDYLHDLPRLEGDADAHWVGFPLLRYVCVAKLLAMSKQLRLSDNTGCWRLLMHSAVGGESTGASSEQLSASALIRAAQVLRDPTLAARDGPDGVDVVEFQAGSLGIILSVARAPFENRLAVKAFVDDPPTASGGGGSGVGQAKASGRVQIGDILHSINGVPIVGVSTEEVKRHIQLIDRPMFMGFLHVPFSEEDAAATTQDVRRQGDDLLSPTSADKPESAKVSSSDFPTYSPEQPAESELALPTHFLPGEMCYAHVETSTQSFVLSHDGSCLSHYLSGKLYITNYRCFFTRLLGRGAIDWQVPVLSIASIDGMDNSPSNSLSGAAMDHAQAVLGFASESDTFRVVIRCKDTQVVRLSFANHAEYSKLYKCLSCLAFPTSLLDAFCFAYSPTLAPSEEVPFDIRREYQRIGLLDVPDHLRCIDQSTRYDLCDTYPQHLVVPSAMSDVRIKAAAAFRSLNRLPVVSWRHRGNGATISRSSQPLVGLKSARSMDDELLVRLLCSISSHTADPRAYTARYVIMDARGQLAAVGNKAMGKGTEIVSNYRGAKLVFMNIDNIHTLRQSFQSLTAIFEPRRGGNEDSSSFYNKVEAAGWLRHVRLVLKASAELAHAVHNGVSVLTHCSDGWDRTSQMVALAELMLDPFYRTLRGFQCLVEKDWCSFGHQFGARCGHARSDVSNDQRSPVFLLWLDCVWQFIRQFPSECEFNEKLLLALADHVFSCKYGTFMFDSERQRKEIFAKHRARSIWSEINSNSELFMNQLFAPSANVPLLSPSTLSKNIKLWKGYFCRWDTTIVPPVPAFQYY